jgi:hypothetical protein
MSDHGDEQPEQDQHPEGRVPWVTAEKLVAWLIGGSALVMVSGIPAAINALVQDIPEPEVGSDGVAQLYGSAGLPSDLLARIAFALRDLGAGASVSLLLLFAATAVLWWHIADLEAAAEGDEPLQPAEIKRAGALLVTVRVLLVITPVAAVGEAFSAMHFYLDFLPSQFGDSVGFVPQMVVPIGIAVGAIAALIGVQSLLRDQRQLVTAEAPATTD